MRISLGIWLPNTPICCTLWLMLITSFWVLKVPYHVFKVKIHRFRSLCQFQNPKWCARYGARKFTFGLGGGASLPLPSSVPDDVYLSFVWAILIMIYIVWACHLFISITKQRQLYHLIIPNFLQGEWLSGSAGMGFTPHIITIPVGEVCYAQCQSKFSHVEVYFFLSFSVVP